MQFREATKADMDYVGEHTVSRGCFKEVPEVIDYTYALEHEGKLLGIGGIKLMNPTTAWGWFDLSKDALKHKTVVYRVIKTYLDTLMRDKNLSRIMAAIEPDFPEAIRTAEHLGFGQESIMLNFLGKGKHAYMYAKLAPKGGN